MSVALKDRTARCYGYKVFYDEYILMCESMLKRCKIDVPMSPIEQEMMALYWVIECLNENLDNSEEWLNEH